MMSILDPPVEDSDNPLVKCGVYNKTKAPLAKVFSVPIKFGKTYSVAIDCDTGVEVVPVFYGEKGLNEKWTAELLSLTTAKYRYFESGHFQRADIIIPPIEWEDQSESGASKPQYVGQYERQLCLLVKVPASNTSSFVVLEGDGSNILDYRTSGTYGKIVAGYDFAEQATNVGPLYDKVLTPKLLWFNDKNIYAFSDTLIQWLLLNVISNADDIDKNITRVQQYISSSEFEKQYGTRYTKPYQKSVWNADMQEFIMKVILSSNSVPKIDRSGYVDRVNETMITKGQKV